MRVTVLMAVLLTVVLFVAQPAGGSPASCDFDPATHVVTVVLDPGVTSRLVRMADGAIHLVAPRLVTEPCGGATVFNTDKIDVTGAVGSHLVISAREGLFAPGFTDEEGGDEVEIRITMPSSDNQLTYEGVLSETNQVISGQNGLNIVVPGDDVPPAGRRGLEPGADVDVQYEGIDGRVTLVGGRGDDIIDARGHSSGTGQSRRGEKLLILGGPPGEGNSGNDELRGSRGKDRLDGLDGDDTIAGDDRVDTLIGGPGRDTLRGEHGSDSFDAFDGESDVIHGGNRGDLQGDTALVDCGLDIVEEVEDVRCG